MNKYNILKLRLWVQNVSKITINFTVSKKYSRIDLQRILAPTSVFCVYSPILESLTFA